MHAADFITGLEPRGRLEDLLQAAACRPEVPLVLLGIDLIGLKRVNETEGFLAGDRLLAAAAARLAAATPTADLRARLGGDELVCVYTGPAAISAAAAARAALQTGSGPPLRCGVVAASAAETPPQLLQRLYAAIQAG